MKKLYSYVGSSDVLKSTEKVPGGQKISCSEDVLRWIDETGQYTEADGLYWATFTVSKERELYIADRRSEHVACAQGEKVLSAGEIAFDVVGKNCEIVEISNQSTGYCPEPESWKNIKRVLEKTGLAFPDDFTFKVIFRKCEKCGERNIVRDQYFVCACCGKELPQEWNF